MTATAAPFCVRSEGTTIEGWSTVRLPFEPKGWLLEYRQQIRGALRDLVALDLEVLHCLYASDLRKHCDVENIVMYNVGPGHFATAARYGIRIERAFRPGPECIERLVDVPGHYQRYSLQNRNTGFETWTVGERLAEWSFDLRKGGALKNCSTVWHAMKCGYVDAAQSAGDHRPLVLILHLYVPSYARLRIADLIKPLADGVMCALHIHDGSDAEELIHRLATRLQISENDASRFLSDAGTAAMGPRRLLFRRGEGIHWNPQDDSIVAMEVLAERTTNEESWRVRGELCFAHESVEPSRLRSL